jgi:hypothetical protein
VLVLVLAGLSLLVTDPMVSANSVNHAAEANSPSIPNYQWQFLSPSERAAVNASIRTIMSQRIKNITLSIVDASGVPYTGKLQATQTSTDFLNWAGWPGAEEGPPHWADYLVMDPSHSFESELDWSQIEPVRGTWDFSGPDWQFGAATAHGMTDFHIWLGPYFARCCYSFPDWAKPLEKSALSNATNYEALKNAMRDYVGAVVSHFKGRVQLYELWWEANAWYGNGNWPLDRIIDIIKMEALTIRDIDPAARICVDLVYLTSDGLQFENSMGSSNWTTDYFAQQLLAAGVPFDVLGLETHIGTGGADAAGGVATLYNWLIDLAKFGKPLYIWEDGLESYLPPKWLAKQGPPLWVGPWHGTPSEAKQAEFMVAETLVYLGNPSVIGLRWVRLYDNPTWSVAWDDDGVFYANGTRKLSYYALGGLWNDLMVNGTVQSVNGVATFRGMAGNYSISTEGFRVEPSGFHVSEGKQNTFSLVLKSTTRTTTSILSTTPTTSGTATANKTVPAPAHQVVENPVLILAGALCIAIVLAAIILRRRKTER